MLPARARDIYRAMDDRVGGVAGRHARTSDPQMRNPRHADGSGKVLQSSTASERIPAEPLHAFSFVLGWSGRWAFTLLGAVASLRPHVIAVATPKPFLTAAGIVRREDGDRSTRAARTCRNSLLRILGSLAATHAPTPHGMPRCIGDGVFHVPFQMLQHFDRLPNALGDTQFGDQ